MDETGAGGSFWIKWEKADQNESLGVTFEAFETISSKIPGAPSASVELLF